MNHFYTKTGDDGTTGLLGDSRARKDAPRLEAVGTLDEANAALGMARAACTGSKSASIIMHVQRDLYNMMAEVAATPETASQFQKIDGERIAWLEKKIGNIETKVEPVRGFIIPGDSSVGAVLDLTRTIVRRAERRVAGLVLNKELQNPDILRYLNRLSSLCFVMELFENQRAGSEKLTFAKE